MAAPYRGRGGGGPPPEKRPRYSDDARLQWQQRLVGKLKAIDPRDARALHAVMEDAGVQWESRKLTALLKELRNARANLELSFKVVDWCNTSKGVAPNVYTYNALISALYECVAERPCVRGVQGHAA